MDIYPATFGSLNGRFEVHDIGEIWTVTLLEFYYDAIHYFNSSSFIPPSQWKHYNHTSSSAPKRGEGTVPPAAEPSGNDTLEEAVNFIANKIVLDGMRYTPCDPTFLEARDALYTAVIALFGSNYHSNTWICLIQRAFAKR